MFFILPRGVYFLSRRIMHWPLEQQVLQGHGRVCTMEFDTKVGSENNIKRKHKTRKLSSPRPFRVPKDFLQRSQKQPEILPEFSGFYSLRACFCLAIIPTTESCEKARADRVVSALPALKVNLRHWERKHLRNNLPDPAGIGIFSQRNSSWFELELYTSKLFWNIDLLQNLIRELVLPTQSTKVSQVEGRIKKLED